MVFKMRGKKGPLLVKAQDIGGPIRKLLIVFLGILIMIAIPLPKTSSELCDFEIDVNQASECRSNADNITIVSDADLQTQAQQKGWQGNGTEANPYIIEGYEFQDAVNYDSVQIGNVTLFFVVRECSFQDSGIRLVDVTNGLVANNSFVGSRLYIHDSTVEVRGNSFSDLAECVITEGSPTLRIAGNLFTNCSKWGVHLDAGRSFNITENLFRDTGLYLNSGSDGNIIDNEFDNGSLFFHPIRTRVIGNTIRAFNWTAVYISSADSAILRDNTIEVTGTRKGWQEKGYTFAIEIDHTRYVTLRNNSMLGAGVRLRGTSYYMGTHDIDGSNTVDGVPILYIKDRVDIQVPMGYSQYILINCTDFNLSGLDLRGGGYNVYIANTDGGTIQRNRISRFFDNPIAIRNSDNIIVTKNVIRDGEGWIDNDYADNVLISDNYFMNISSWDAVRAWRCKGIKVLRNYFVDMSGSAAFFYMDSSGGTVAYNHLKASYLDAIDIHGDDYLAHHNYFVDNNLDPGTGEPRGPQAACTKAVAWDDGSAGNYWSDYQYWYPDATNDNWTWDEPYVVLPGRAQDNHPLVNFYDVIPPIAVAGDDITIKMGDTLDLDGSASIDNIGIRDYRWTFFSQGQVELHGMRVSHTFEGRGYIRVTLRVTDAVGNWDEDHFYVTVVDPVAPVARAGEDVTVNQGTAVTFDASLSTDNFAIRSYLWSFVYGDHTVQRDQAIFNFRFDIPGKYVVTLTVADFDDNKDTDELVVTVLDTVEPRAVAGEDVDIEQHQKASFDASRSYDNVGIVHLEWSFEYRGETVVRNTYIFEFTFDVVGSFVVTLNVSDAAGNWADDKIIVTVHDVTPPSADAGEDIVIGQGEYAQFNGAGCRDNVGIWNWSWDFVYRERAIYLPGPSPEFLFMDMGTYVVRLTVMDEAGNWAEDELTVTVLDATPPQARAVPLHEIYQHQTVEFDATMSEDNVGIEGYLWAFEYGGKNITLHGPTPRFTFDLAGEYVVGLLLTDAEGNQNTTSVLVKVSDTEPPKAIAQGDIHIMVGEEAVFNGTASTDNVGVVKWGWAFKYRKLDQLLSGPEASFVFDEPGVYAVSLTVWDEQGFGDTTTFKVHVESLEGPSDDDAGSGLWLLLLIMVVILATVAGLFLLKGRMAQG